MSATLHQQGADQAVASAFGKEIAGLPDMPAVVDAQNLFKTYTGKVEVPVLRGVTMRVYPGEFVAVMGQSGSGKSTLLNLLGCLDRPTSGALRLAGHDVSTLSDDQMAALRGDVLGFVFQAHFLLDEFTCRENVLLPLLIRQGGITPQDEERVDALLVRVGLADQMHKTPDTMSGGQCQRCALIRALANRPRLVLADEPTGNLDRTSGEEVFRLLREICSETGVAVVMVTHDDRLARAANRILVIEDGRIQEMERTFPALMAQGKGRA